jgi:heptosyltransferase I
MRPEHRFHPERASTLLRFSDKYLGIPIAFLIGLLKKKTNAPENLKRIALLKTAAIGDTILTSAVIKDIRDKYPKSEIVMFAGSSNIEAAEMLDGLNKVIRLPIRNPIAAGRLIRSQGEFDALIEFGPWPRIDAILSSFARAKYKIGFMTKGQFRHYVYSVAVPHSSYTHEVANFKKLLRPLGISGPNLPSISVEGEFDDSDYVVVHMFPGGSRSYLKAWDEDNWIALVGSLTRSGLNVYLTGARSDSKRAIRIKDEVGSEKVVVAAGMFSLRDTALLLKSSKLVISVDTGVMHMASALGCNLIALHGPSSPLRWGPLSNQATVFYRNRIGPCIDLGFESRCRVNQCMHEITAEEVIEKSRALIGKPRRGDTESSCPDL